VVHFNPVFGRGILSVFSGLSRDNRDGCSPYVHAVILNEKYRKPLRVTKVK